MKQYDHIIIGFGKGGKTLAGALASQGKSVALVERSEKMFGGTCINIACIPSKYLETQARRSAALGGDFSEKAERYAAAIAGKRRLTAALREKNYAKAVHSGVDVLVGSAEFVDEHTVSVTAENGTVTKLRGEYLFINTGAQSALPSVPGLAESRYLVTSTSLMERDALPQHLVIIGGGYIGLEFASYYVNFGSQVTLVQHGTTFLPREDREMAAAVLADLESRGVHFLMGAETQRVRDMDDHGEITLLVNGAEKILSADAVLAATGRRPELTGLHPERAGVALTDRGAVRVGSDLRTSVPHMFAMGDVTGGQQFTYISLDDSRIVRSQLLGDGSRTTENRGAVPYSVFLDPPFSRVGMSEEDARKAYAHVGVGTLAAGAIPKAKVLGEDRGLLKAVVDLDTGRILGAHLFCVESHEIINLIKLAMDAGIPYTTLRDGIYTHPTMTEALNDLFAAVR